jgi:uncharacterized protein (TIGR02421 family)
MVWSTYKEKIKQLSEQIVDAQRPIRVLDAIKWPAGFDEALRKGKFKEVPEIDASYYQSMNLGFDSEAKLTELEELVTRINTTLGKEDELGQLMVTNCRQYQDVVRMLQVRGTKEFYQYSKILYGSPKDKFLDEKTTVNEVARSMYDIFGILGDRVLGVKHVQDQSAEQVVSILNEKFSAYFHDNTVRAKISDGIIADSAAGGDVVKIKEGAMFTLRDVAILEVHEGWVHVGTTLNGQNQHVARFLSKGPPRVAGTQEGLAILLEIFTFSSYPRRGRTINDRVLGIDKVEDGANLLELIEFYRTEGYSEQDCISNAKRVFRGGTLDGGAPFTKDIAYIKGLIDDYNFMRAAMRAGKPEYIRFLFVGKINAMDVPLLYRKHLEGIIDEPKYVPPQFVDLDGIAVWMSFSNVFNMIDMSKVQEHFARIF